jgi:hypothetical protein
MRTRRIALALALELLAAATVLSADTLTRITDLRPGDDDGLPGLAAAVAGGQLYFVGRTASAGTALWRYDGVSAPVLVPDSDPLDPVGLAAWNGELYFQGGPSGDRELWRFDPVGGTLAEAVDVRSDGNALPVELAPRGDRICFAAFLDGAQRELVCWDGDGPAEIHDLEPGPDSSYPTGLVATGARLAFVARSAGEDRLWILDGDQAPLALEPEPGEPYSSPCCAVPLGAQTFFGALDGDSVSRLWRHDGGAAAPTRVSPTFEAGGYPALFRGRVVVGGTDGTPGATEELWRRGASGFRRLAPGLAAEQADGAALMREALFLRAYVGGDDLYALYRYCGGGRAVVLSDPFAGDPSITSSRPIAFGGRLFVSAVDETHGEELWAFASSHVFCDDFESGDDAWWSASQPRAEEAP